jgi:hypothetical protein
MSQRKLNSIKCRTLGSSDFDPDVFFHRWVLRLDQKSFQDFINEVFGLESPDEYIYHATASVTLHQVQVALNAGDSNKLHEWCRDNNGRAVSILRQKLL